MAMAIFQAVKTLVADEFGKKKGVSKMELAQHG